jgi:transposase
MLEYSLPPGYRRQKPIRRPKLGPWLGVIDAILEQDKQRPKKQRHTAKRIFERLRAEHSYSGGYTIVKDYVRQSKLGSQEMFVPLSHAPGEAQADFGAALVVIGGVEQTAHFMAFDLPHSDDCFVQAFPAETTEAFLEGHVRAFAYWGAVPTRILYDNVLLSKLAGTALVGWRNLRCFHAVAIVCRLRLAFVLSKLVDAKSSICCAASVSMGGGWKGLSIQSQRSR